MNDGEETSFETLFALSPDGADLWSAPGAPDTDEKRLYGGLLLGQAVAAASAGTRRCHALHALFLRAGHKRVPFLIDVERTRDGRSFSARRIKIRQGEQVLLEAYSSHHDGDRGPDRHSAMPTVTPPEALEDRRVVRRRRASDTRRAFDYLAERMLDARPLPPDRRSEEHHGAIWIKPRAPVSGGPELHHAVIAFASDLEMVRAGLHNTPAVRDGARLDTTSLDHSIWFHRPVAAAGDWMLHVVHGRTIADGRGWSESSIFTRDGVLVASAAQEFLARDVRD